MGVWDGIAALGLAGRGYEATDKVIRDRDWQEEERARQKKLNDMALAEAVRKDELARGLRERLAQVPSRPAAMGLDVTTPAENDPYGEGYVRTDKGFEAPAQADVRGKMAAAQDYLAQKGEMEQAEKYRKALKALESEGYQSIVVGVAGGKTPKEIAEQFNAVGEKRIVGGSTDGRNYRFKFEDGTETTYNRDQMRDLATAHGFLKKPETKIVPAGSVETVDGKPVFTNTNVKPEDPEVKAARLDLIGAQTEAARARAERDSAKAAEGPKPPKPRNWTSFDNEVSRAAGDLATSTDVTGKKAIDYDRKGQIRSLAQKLAREDPEAYDSPAAAVDAAVERLDAVRGDAVRRATREVDENPDAPAAYRETREKYIARRSAEIAKRELRNMGKAKEPERAPATSATPKPKAATTSYMTTDGKELPENTRVRDKNTGKVMVVRNGQLIEE